MLNIKKPWLVTVSSLAVVAALGVSTPSFAALSANTDAGKVDTHVLESLKYDSWPTDSEKFDILATEKQDPLFPVIDIMEPESAFDDQTVRTAPKTDMDGLTEAAPEVAVEGQIIYQDADMVMLSTIVGSTVTNQNGEEIGDVKDVILDKDGKVLGVVIGVGGFLGIGEKRVALEFDRVTLTEDDGAYVLSTDISVEELENAPEFKSTEVQVLEEQNRQRLLEQQRLQRDSKEPMIPTQTN